MAKIKRNRRSAIQPYNTEQWEIEEDLRCLARARAVKADPERMKKVKTLAKEKLAESKRRQDEAEYMVDLGEGKVAEGT